ncbi:MAG TPA: DUF1501 domain-containing protein [Pyrinomonadaceae bacterium]|jgi:uncharacterized protein (DUF1501 family)
MKQNRREFLIKSASALSMAALAAQTERFGVVSALAQTKKGKPENARLAPPGDYKALVCISLDGGNDGNNMVVPKHADANVSGYAQYAAARAAKGLAIARAELLSINVPRLNNLEYGFHPNFGDMTANGLNRGVHELFAQQKLAVVANVGTLVEPMTRRQYIDNSVPKPYQLGSHFDQQAQMYSARADVRFQIGWGGRIADYRQALDNAGALIPMISSINGSTLFTLGGATRALTLADAATPLNRIFVLNGFENNDPATVARRRIFDRLRTRDLTSELIKSASHVTDQAVTAGQAFGSQQEVTVNFPNTEIGRQLKQVARIIRKRSEVNVRRQIFFVHFGGFDTHNGQVAGQTDGQNGLFFHLSQAMRAFYDELTVQAVESSVTAFTLSEFGRTFDPADSGINVGSDHAWGNHMLVMGGAVRGGDFYGSTRPDGSGDIFPTLVKNGPDDADNAGSAARGRWIPTVSVEQYAATLTRWFGVPDNEINAIFPNLSNFALSDLGFMNNS